MPGNVRTALLKVVALLPPFVVAVSAPAQEPVFPRLTPKLQDLLIQEMVAIHDASQNILTALISGEDARVAELAQQIHDSFILEQGMTGQDRQDLVSAVPPEFVQMDQELHALSEELAEAAREGNAASQLQLFGAMVEACAACHAMYATDRFPSFAE